MNIDAPGPLADPTPRWNFETAPDSSLPADLGYEAALPGLQLSAPAWNERRPDERAPR